MNVSARLLSDLRALLVDHVPDFPKGQFEGPVEPFLEFLCFSYYLSGEGSPFQKVLQELEPRDRRELVDAFEELIERRSS